MNTIYIDFDNTIVENNKKIIELLNKEYGLSKTESDLIDYNYNSIAPITRQEKVALFQSDEFFDCLEFKDGFLDFFNKYSEKMNFVVVTKGTPINLEKKISWLKKNLPKKIDFIGMPNSLSKKRVNMRDGIQIDDTTIELDTDAQIKILYKSDNNFDWQQGYDNSDIIVVNTWKEIDDVISFYLKYDYKTLNRKEGK